MQFNKLKALILATSAVAGLAFLAPSVQAASTATMNVTVDSIDAVAVTKLNDMNFGRWLLTHDGAGGDIVITLDPEDNSATAVTGGTSTAQQIAGTSRSGRLQVVIPAGINNYDLDMIVAVAPTAFTDAAAFSIDNLTYATASQTGSNAITINSPETVTVITGGLVGEVVSFGADLTVAAQPVANGIDTASFDVEFTY